MSYTIEELVEALRGLEELGYRPGEDGLTGFERVADAFYRATGRMRLGKSQPLEFPHTDEERQAAWREWIEKKYASARAALAKHDEQFLVYTKDEPGHGDVCLWWGPNRTGYTRFVDEAGHYTRVEAESICQGGNEVAVPLALARVKSKSVVRLEDVS